MEGEFFCTKPGGIRIDSFLVIQEGTRKAGPWYPAYQFSDEQITDWIERGWIVFREVK